MSALAPKIWFLIRGLKLKDSTKAFEEKFYQTIEKEQYEKI